MGCRSNALAGGQLHVRARAPDKALVLLSCPGLPCPALAHGGGNKTALAWTMRECCRYRTCLLYLRQTCTWGGGSAVTKPLVPQMRQCLAGPAIFHRPALPYHALASCPLLVFVAHGLLQHGHKLPAVLYPRRYVRQGKALGGPGLA